MKKRKNIENDSHPVVVLKVPNISKGEQFFTRFHYLLLINSMIIKLYFPNLFSCKAATLSSNSALSERSRPTSLSVAESLQTKSIYTLEQKDQWQKGNNSKITVWEIKGDVTGACSRRSKSRERQKPGDWRLLVFSHSSLIIRSHRNFLRVARHYLDAWNRLM